MDVLDSAVHSISWRVNVRISNSSSSANRRTYFGRTLCQRRAPSDGTFSQFGYERCYTAEAASFENPREHPFAVPPGGANLGTSRGPNGAAPNCRGELILLFLERGTLFGCSGIEETRAAANSVSLSRP